MQRVAVSLLWLLSLPSILPAQHAAGATLWRVVGTTVPVPPALATGAAAALWNPAQAGDSARVIAALEAIQSPAAIGATGMIATVRLRTGKVGYFGVVYGRVGLTDITRTDGSPNPAETTIPVFTQAVGATWGRALGNSGKTAVGATLAHQYTRLDDADAGRWTLDVGVAREIVTGVRVAAATHFFSAFSGGDPAQDLYAGIEGRLWRGPLWGGTAALYGRYGVAVGHGFPADHWVGAGFAAGDVVAVDAAVVREGGYGDAGWRPVGGVRVTVGKYRVTLARDAGMSELGSSYRVGVEARFP